MINLHHFGHFFGRCLELFSSKMIILIILGDLGRKMIKKGAYFNSSLRPLLAFYKLFKKGVNFDIFFDR